MEYVYGALLLHKTGQPITAEALAKVVSATGKSADEAQVKALVASLQGVDIAKELESASLAPAASAAPAATKEEKKEEVKPEEAAEGLSALFG